MSMENSIGVGRSNSNSDGSKWTITKKLIRNDVNGLEIEEDTVTSHILDQLTSENREKVDTKGGLKILALDFDCEGSGPFEITLKRHPLPMVFGRSCVLADGWKEHFAQRRMLVNGDEVGLFWNKAKEILIFSLLKSYANSDHIINLGRNHCIKNNARLFLKKGDFLLRHILDNLSDEKKARVLGRDEIQIPVFDKDNCCSFNLTFMVHGKGGFFAFANGWQEHFVQRRNLRVNDKIGLCWNNDCTTLIFSVQSQ